MKALHVSSVAPGEERRRPRRGLGKVGKVLVAMGMILTTLTATQGTALAADNEAKPASEFIMACTKDDGTGWFFETNSEERVRQAMDDCLKDGGHASLSLVG